MGHMLVPPGRIFKVMLHLGEAHSGLPQLLSEIVKCPGPHARGSLRREDHAVHRHIILLRSGFFSGNSSAKRFCYQYEPEAPIVWPPCEERRVGPPERIREFHPSRRQLLEVVGVVVVVKQAAMMLKCLSYCALVVFCLAVPSMRFEAQSAAFEICLGCSTTAYCTDGLA